MRLMSFALTTPQFLDGSKDVTRRLNWLKTKAGDRIRAVKQVQGIKLGEKVVDLGVIEVVSVRRERLDAITPDDVRREGYPGMSPFQFVEMFGRKMGCQPSTVVTRIEFRRVAS